MVILRPLDFHNAASEGGLLDSFVQRFAEAIARPRPH
ncbi:hypothetical protein MESS4_750026 [Mesorhizobium sp. STM 4661]|nr:hypothetical protein MESS4_750026 [Mesorhizobium sp. STM 4661]